MSGVVASDRGSARVLTISRPERRNALTVEVVEALAAELQAAEPGGARAVVIQGADQAFCSGGDLQQLVGFAEQGAAKVADVVYSHFHKLVRTLSESSLPIVAAIDGPALGAGFDLALLCDFRIASDRAVFGSSWIDVGLVPGMGGAHLLPRIVNPTAAADLLLTGRRLKADEALELGLLHRVVPVSKLSAAVDELVDAIGAKPAMAVSRTLASLRRSNHAGLSHELDVLGGVQGGMLTSDDFRRATASFLSRPG